ANHREQRPEDFFLLETRARFDAGENRGLEVVPAIETGRRGPLAATAQLRTFRTPNFDVALHLLHRGAIDERPDVGPTFAPVAQPKRAYTLLQHRDEIVVHAVLHDETARRRTPLTRGAERSPQHAFQREIEIRVVDHDATRFGGTGERNDRHIGMLDQRGTRILTVSVYELDHLGRQARLEQQLHQHGYRVRDIFRGLDDHRVSAQQRGEHLPRGDRHGEVERRHQTGDPDRPPKTHCPFVAQLTRHRVAEETAAFGCGVVRRVDALLYVALGFAHGFAHLARHERRDVVFARAHQVADAAEHIAATRR